MAQNLRRKLGSIAWAENEVKSFDLPRNYAYQKILLRLTGDISIVTAAATAYTEAAWKLIKRLEIVGNGKDVIWYIDGPALARYGHLFRGVVSASAVPTAVAANQAMNSFMVLDFAMLRSIKPIDTLLNAFQYSTLELRITWGAKSDMYSANAANVTINSGTLKLQSLESIGNAGGMIAKVFTIEKEVTATSTDFQLTIPVRNAYRGFLIRAEVDGNPNDSVINSLEIKSGADTFVQTDWNVLRDDNKLDMDLETMPTGYAFIDFCPDGYLSEALATQGMANLDIYFNVTKQTGTNKITVYPVELMVPSKAA